MIISLGMANRIAIRAGEISRAIAGIDLTKILFEQQIDAVGSKKRFKAFLCSRRSGKSFALAAALVDAALEFPGSSPLYITIAREKAKEIIWTPLKDINAILQLGMDFKEHTGEIRFPNGSIIRLMGAGSMREIDKARGPKYPIAVIDEAQLFPRSMMDYMIDDVLENATRDYAGTIIVAGTPNPACVGSFYDITTGITPGWETHKWTQRENIFFYKAIPELVEEAGGFEAYLEKDLDEMCERRGWTREHPSFLRETMGIWVKDSSESVFRVKSQEDHTINVLEDAHDWRYIVGVDIGFEEPCAFVVLAYSCSIGKVRVIESRSEEHLIPSRLAVEVEKLVVKYQPEAVVMDTNGSGKGYQKECELSFGLNIESADKEDKLATIEFINGDLRTGVLGFLPEASSLLEQMQILPWNQVKKEKGEYEFARGYLDHEPDAFRYAYRLCRQHMYMPEEERHKIKKYSREYYDKIEQQIIDGLVGSVDQGSGLPAGALSNVLGAIPDGIF